MWIYMYIYVHIYVHICEHIYIHTYIPIYERYDFVPQLLIFRVKYSLWRHYSLLAIFTH
jgi:hypothetical protein